MENSGSFWYFLLFVSAIIVYYGLSRTLNKQDKFIEGLTSRNDPDKQIKIENVPEAVQAGTENLNVNLKDHRKHYENILIDLYHNIAKAQLNNLREVATLVSANPTSDEAIQKMKNVTVMTDFKNSLDSSMSWMDKN